MSARDRLPATLRKMLVLDPAHGRKALGGWIALNEHAASLYAESVSKYEADDAATLDPADADERRALRGELTDLRDRYTQAATDARTVRTRLAR